jgi:hypothetical protein
MISNMDMRLALTKHADHIIKNNQNISTGNCNDIVKINNSSELLKTPYLLTDLYNYFTLENSDIKKKYLSEYMYTSNLHNLSINIK